MDVRQVGNHDLWAVMLVKYKLDSQALMLEARSSDEINLFWYDLLFGRLYHQPRLAHCTTSDLEEALIEPWKNTHWPFLVFNTLQLNAKSQDVCSTDGSSFPALK